MSIGLSSYYQYYNFLLCHVFGRRCYIQRNFGEWEDRRSPTAIRGNRRCMLLDWVIGLIFDGYRGNTDRMEKRPK